MCVRWIVWSLVAIGFLFVAVAQKCATFPSASPHEYRSGDHHHHANHATQ